MSLLLQARLTQKAKRCLLSKLLKKHLSNPCAGTDISFHLPARVSPRMQHHTLGRGSGAVPSGGTRLSVTSSHWHNQIPPKHRAPGNLDTGTAQGIPSTGNFPGNSAWVHREYTSRKVPLLRDVQHLGCATAPAHEQLPTACPGWDLFVRLCQCQLSSNYSPVLSGFILQISNWCFFTQAFQLHSSN